MDLRSLTKLFVVTVIVVVFASPHRAYSHGDTLVVYATLGSLNAVINGDAGAHTVYELVSLDTTYKFNTTITVNSSVAIVGRTGANGRPPCIQPTVLPDGSVPPSLFEFGGNNTNVTLKNLYMLGRATNNEVAQWSTAVTVSGNYLRIAVDSCVFDSWTARGLSYTGMWDNISVTNSDFRNQIDPISFYGGQGAMFGGSRTAQIDSVIMTNDTFLSLGAYVFCPPPDGTVSYFGFTHNTVIYTFKPTFFIFDLTNARINNNIFYCNFAAGVTYPENPSWDNLNYPDSDYGVISFEPLSDGVAALFDPADSGKSDLDSLAESKRVIEVDNNDCYWPQGYVSFMAAWNDTAHFSPSGDSVITANFMNERTIGMFSDKSRWPGFTASGNMTVDPGYADSIAGVLTNDNGTGTDGAGFESYFRDIRTVGSSANSFGYKLTKATSAADWVPVWPLPEAAVMKYSNAALKTAGTDFLPLGDLEWWGLNNASSNVLAVVPRPLSFAGTILDSSRTAEVDVRNVSATTQVLDSIYTGTSLFNTDVKRDSISSGDTLKLQVTFSPTRLGTCEDTLYLHDSTDSTLIRVPITGVSPYPTIAVDTAATSFVGVSLSDTTIGFLRIDNTSINNLTIDSIYSKSGAFFPFAKSLSVKDSADLAVGFHATAYGNYSDTLFLRNNSLNKLVTVPLRGVLMRPAILKGTQLDCGEVAVGDSALLPILLGSTYDGSSQVDSIYTGSAGFSVSPNHVSLGSHDTLAVLVKFKPDAFGTYTDSIVVHNITRNSYLYIKLTGSSPSPALMPHDSTLQWGEVKVDSSVVRSLVIADSSVNKLRIDSVYTGTAYFKVGSLSLPFFITRKDSMILFVTFKPDSGGEFIDTLTITSNSGNGIVRIPLSAKGTATGINEGDGRVPTSYALLQNYPNPFNPTTTIEYQLPKRSNVTLEVFDVLGQEIATLVKGEENAGSYKVTFDGAGFASGVYLYRLHAGSFVATRKFVLMK